VDYLKIVRGAELMTIAENLEKEPQKQYTGIVTKVGFNYILVTFLNASCAKIPTTDMDEETLAKFANNELVVEETELNFYIDAIIDSQTIMATQNFRSREIWNNIKENAPVGTKVTGTIQNINSNLVFIWLDELDVITAIARLDNHQYEAGTQIQLIIKNVDTDKRMVETSVASKRYAERQQQ
jgi:ribosomal protein S1